jgi:hypothetical protein
MNNKMKDIIEEYQSITEEKMRMFMGGKELIVVEMKRRKKHLKEMIESEAIKIARLKGELGVKHHVSGILQDYHSLKYLSCTYVEMEDNYVDLIFTDTYDRTYGTEYSAKITFKEIINFDEKECELICMTAYINHICGKIKEREKEIDILKDKLAQATKTKVDFLLEMTKEN